MNIAVIIRQVPDTEAAVKPHPANQGAIVEDGVKFILNPYDEYAVEEALRITEKDGGEVVGVCIGPQRSETAIRMAMAMGMARAILISDAPAVEADLVTQGGILAAAIKGLSARLILCGREMIDTQNDAAAAVVAHRLGIPHVLAASKIEISGDKATVVRDIEGGSLEIETALPAAISCQKGLNEPRYPTLIAIKRAKNKEIKKMTLAELGLAAAQPKSRVTALRPLQARSAGVKVAGSPEEVAGKCAAWLSETAKVI
ncbi:MAG: electron transfer flavoprotein subunit beta/FixA family protein [Elusimicrobia bacterium]|nr:electron transfer flavoprotein subunit beta/FixA family protein [Elusimicrobiota bacterium]